MAVALIVVFVIFVLFTFLQFCAGNRKAKDEISLYKTIRTDLISLKNVK